MNLVPAVKRSLEVFLFAVKSVLQKHGALAAFWVGNLKHRNLEGQIVSSQLRVSSESDEEDERPRRVHGYLWKVFINCLAGENRCPKTHCQEDKDGQ